SAPAFVLVSSGRVDAPTPAGAVRLWAAEPADRPDRRPPSPDAWSPTTRLIARFVLGHGIAKYAADPQRLAEPAIGEEQCLPEGNENVRNIGADTAGQLAPGTTSWGDLEESLGGRLVPVQPREGETDPLEQALADLDAGIAVD